MKEINHHCVICGQGYHACDSCDKIHSFTPWRSLADTMNHYKIYLILSDYYHHKIDQSKAQYMLDSCDLTGWQDFKIENKQLIAEILGVSNE